MQRGEPDRQSASLLHAAHSTASATARSSANSPANCTANVTANSTNTSTINATANATNNSSRTATANTIAIATCQTTNNSSNHATATVNANSTDNTTTNSMASSTANPTAKSTTKSAKEVTMTEPIAIAKALCATATELQKAVYATKLDKLACQKICDAMRNLAPLYSELLQLCEAGAVDPEFDTWVWHVFFEALQKLESAKEEVYKYMVMKQTGRLNQHERSARASSTEHTLQQTHQTLHDALRAITVYLAAKSAQLQLQHSLELPLDKDQELQQLSPPAQEAVEQLQGMGLTTMDIPAEAPLSPSLHGAKGCYCPSSNGAGASHSPSLTGADASHSPSPAAAAAFLFRSLHGGERELAKSCVTGADKEMVKAVAQLYAGTDKRKRTKALETMVRLSRHGLASELVSAGAVIALWRHIKSGCPPPAALLALLARTPTGRDAFERCGAEEAVHMLQLPATFNGWDRCVYKLRGHTSSVSVTCFSPDGRLLASGSWDAIVCVWDASSGKCLHTLKGHKNVVADMSFSSIDEQLLLASGSCDNTVRVWDPNSGQCLHTLQGHRSSVWTTCFSPDGRLLVSGSSDNTVRVWDCSSGQCLHILRGHTNWVRTVCFSPDGRLLASGSEDDAVRVWDPSNGKCLQVLKGHVHSVFTICFSIGRLLASGSGDGTVQLWDPSGGQCLHVLKGHGNDVLTTCFSPDGRLLASGSMDNTVRVWDPNTGLCLHVLKGHKSIVKVVGFSPDGRLLASGSHDKTVRVWDPRSGQCLHTLKGHKSDVQTTCFSPDGQILVSGSRDGMVRVWNPNANWPLS